MQYEVSTQVLNHKYNEWEIRHICPFIGKGRGQTYITNGDTPSSLAALWKMGFSLKPHPFVIESEKDIRKAEVNSIVLDFDNLTKEQFDFVKEHSEYGDESAGMKTWRKAHEGIDGATPSRWKYKVFFATQPNTLCIYEDLSREFKRAVAHYNPTKKADEVEETWALWLKANNKSKFYKHAAKNHLVGEPRELKRGEIVIEDERFKDWILPDVAMLTSFRTQITYGVDVNQVEKKKVIPLEDPKWRSLFNKSLVGMSAFRVGWKKDYRGIPWKEREIEPPPPTKNEIDDAEKKFKAWFPLVKKAMSELTDEMPYIHIPYAKSMMARAIGKNEIEDLVMDEQATTLIGSLVFSKSTHDGNPTWQIPSMNEIEASAKQIAKAVVRNAKELLHQGGAREGCRLKSGMPNYVISDILTLLRKKHGLKIFAALDSRKVEKISKAIAKTIAAAMARYPTWRLMKKVEMLTCPSMRERYMSHWRRWKESGDKDEIKSFFVEKKKVEDELLEMARNAKFAYSYRKKGVKSRLLEEAEILTCGEPFRDEAAWVEWCRGNICEDKDGSFDDSTLRSWFRDYRSKWNSCCLSGEQHIRKSTKYNIMFNGKSDEEISKIIKNLDVSRAMKSKLRRKYLSES